jgi:hypothetical protein
MTAALINTDRHERITDRIAFSIELLLGIQVD